MSCGCGNPWNPHGGLSTQEVCGEFTEPENPDLGQCSAYRSKRSCEAPTKPENLCNDTAAYAEYDPTITPPFRIIATIHDENCDPILDEESNPILGAF